MGTYDQQKKPRIFPPMCLCLASSWVKMPWLVEMTRWPNCLEGRMLLVHFSKSVRARSQRGEMTPHLLTLPMSSMTIFLDLWSSMISNSPMQPWVCMRRRKRMMSLEAGRMMTCLQPLRSALTMFLRQSAKTFILTIGGDNNQYLTINHSQLINTTHPRLISTHHSHQCPAPHQLLMPTITYFTNHSFWAFLASFSSSNTRFARYFVRKSFLRFLSGCTFTTAFLNNAFTSSGFSMSVSETCCHSGQITCRVASNVVKLFIVLWPEYPHSSSFCSDYFSAISSFSLACSSSLKESWNPFSLSAVVSCPGTNTLTGVDFSPPSISKIFSSDFTRGAGFSTTTSLGGRWLTVGV